MKNNDCTRVTIRITNEVKKYFEGESLKTGLPQSTLMLMALQYYIKNKENKDI